MNRELRSTFLPNPRALVHLKIERKKNGWVSVKTALSQLRPWKKLLRANIPFSKKEKPLHSIFRAIGEEEQTLKYTFAWRILLWRLTLVFIAHSLMLVFSELRDPFYDQFRSCSVLSFSPMLVFFSELVSLWLNWR